MQCLAAKPGIMIARAVSNFPLSKQTSEVTVFQLAALVSHIHTLMQQNTAIFIHLNKKVSHLRPRKHGQGQIHTPSGQAAADLTGGDTLRRGSCSDFFGDPAAYGSHPIQNSQDTQSQHNQIYGIHGPAFGHGLGEHFFRNRQRHGQRFPILQPLIDRTGNDGALNLIAEDGLGVLQVLGADEGRLFLRSIGECNGKVHRLHRKSKAGKQGDSQNQIALFIFRYGIGKGIPEGKGIAAGTGNNIGQLHIAHT